MNARTPGLPRRIIEPLVRMALEEDLGLAGDITSNAVIPPEARARVVMTAREEGRIAGLDLAEAAFRHMDPALGIRRLKPEGADADPGDAVLSVEGAARAILAAERVALNFTGRLSGIATLARDMVRAASGHKARIAATRKTTPGLRAVEKYAVEAGGGIPHRYGLYDAVMIKDNHIAVAGGIRAAIRAARKAVGHTVKIEAEADTLAQLAEAMEEGPDIVLLDNMGLADMEKAVALVGGRALVEASGGVTLDRIPAIAATGVDIISAGALTHSARNLDMGLDAPAPSDMQLTYI